MKNKGKKKTKPDCLTVVEAARLMHKNPQFVALGLQQGVFGFGYAVKTSTTYAYYINRNKFFEETGIIDTEGSDDV